MESNTYQNDINTKDDVVVIGLPKEIKNKKHFPKAGIISKIGGLPTWLAPLSNKISLSFFTCSCGKPLSFLMQLDSSLDDYIYAYYRVLYVFFCSICWKRNDLVKVLRIQLPKDNALYNEDTLLKKDLIENDETCIKVNDYLKTAPMMLKEFAIDAVDEYEEASKKYFRFYNNIHEESNSSCESSSNNNNNTIKHVQYDINDDDDDDSDEDEEFGMELSSKEKDKMNKMMSAYSKENPDDDINKVEIEDVHEIESDKLLTLHSDKITEVFQDVVKYDPTQVIRYYRNNYHPLWFTSQHMFTVHNTKCKQCKGDVAYEFQLMPYLLSIQPQIRFLDIGTIIIYTCKKSCTNNNNNNNEGDYIEEYGFIQRTGEGFIVEDGKLVMKDGKETSMQTQSSSNNINSNNQGQGKIAGINEDEMDEDGFCEVKKSKKRK